MQVNHLISNVLRGLWLIDQQTAHSWLPIVFAMMEGQPTAFGGKQKEKKDTRPFAVSALAGTTVRYSSFDGAPSGSVAITPVTGPLMREDNCGTPGMATIGQRFQEADAHENIAAHVLYVNSGGGTVDYTEILASTVKGSQKPVVTYVDGVMASAAYWIGSSADTIIVGARTATIGSIGTQISLMSPKKAMEERGFQFHNVRATESKDKNEAYLQLLDGKYELLIEQILDPLNSVFLQTVDANREGKLDPKKENVKTGKTYLAEQAIEYGLADEMGNLDYAVARALQLAESNPVNQSKSHTMFNKFPKLSAFAKLKAEEQTPERLAELKAELTAQGVTTLAIVPAGELETSANLTAELEKVATALEAAGVPSVEALAKERDGLKAEVARLGKQPGEKPTAPTKPAGDVLPTGGQEVKSITDPEAEHNQLARRYGL